jgi:glycosyltransferase involved in cell wall biosynthesis
MTASPPAVRILNVNNSLDALDGGQSERTLQMSRALALAGEDVEVLVGDKGLSADRISAVEPAHVTSVATLNRRFYVPSVSAAMLDQLVREADIIHLMGYWSPLNVLVSRAAYTAGKPFVVCPAGSWRIVGRSKLLKRAYEVAVGRRMIATASRLIAITEDERDLFRSRGVPEHKICVIPNAIDPAAYRSEDDEQVRRQWNLGSRPFILFLGRLNPIKGPDLLLEAYEGSSLSASHDLVFAGSDERMQASLEERAAAAGLARHVHFIGYIGGADKSRLIHACDFMVIPSRYEAMSIVALEAGAAGKPLVLTRACGFDGVEEAGGGILADATVESLRAGLDRIGAADRAAMGRRMRDFVMERFTWGSVAAQYQRVYGQVVAEHEKQA